MPRDRAGRRSLTRAVWLAAAGVFVVAMLSAPLMPLFDPDEGYYPATAAESVDAGDYWDLRFNGAPRWDKPILSYALIEASFAILGRSVVAARLPSALQGASLVLIVGLVISSLSTESAAGACAAVLSSTLGVQVFSRVAHPEIAVVLAITAAELVAVKYLVATTRSQRRRLAVLIGLAIGYGVLAKGPVALVLPALAVMTAAPLVRGWRRPSGPAWVDGALALAIALTVAVPWYAAMAVRHGEAFLNEAIWRHNVSRYTGAAFGHRSGILYFIPPLLIAILPWTMFLPGALRAVDRRDRSPAGILRIVMGCAAATGFAFYSLSVSKLPHYALAFVPPLAILIGLHLDERLKRGIHAQREFRLTAVLHGAAGITLIVLPWLVGRLFTARQLLGGSPARGAELHRLLELAVWPPALILVGFSVLVFRRPPGRRALLTTGLGVVLPVVIILSARPMLRITYEWDRLGGEIRHTPQPVWLVGPRSPSLTFFASRPISQVTQNELSDLLTRGAEGWIIVDTEWLRDARNVRRFPHVRIDIRDQSGTMTLAHVAPADPVTR